MTFDQLVNSLRDGFANVFAWFRHDEKRFDAIDAALSRLGRDQQFFTRQLFERINKMSAQTDALTAEVDKVVAVLQSGDALLKASADAQAQLQSHLAGDALDTAAVQAATDKLSAARTAFEADVAKLSPAAQATTSDATVADAPAPIESTTEAK